MKRWLWWVVGGGFVLAGAGVTVGLLLTRSPGPYEPRLEISPRTGITIGSAVVFRCLDPGIGIPSTRLRQIRYLWKFGDGNSAEGKEVTYQFRRPGQWTVTLTVEAVDQRHRFHSATAEEKVTVDLVKIPEPVAVIDYSPKQIQTDTRVEFDASRSYPRSPIPEVLQPKWEYAWDFGDGTPKVSGQRIAHVFPRPGDYTVRLTVAVTDQFNQQVLGAAEQRIAVANRPPVPDVRVEPTPVLVGAPVIFDATNSRDPDGETLYFEWDFDGDRIRDAEGARVKYERGFSSPGSYDVRVHIYDESMRRRSEQPLVHSVAVTVYGSPAGGPLTSGGWGTPGLVASAGLATVGDLRLWSAALGWTFLGGQWLALGGYGQLVEPWVVDRTDEFPEVQQVGGWVETVVEQATITSLEAGYRVPTSVEYPLYLLVGVGVLQLQGVHRSSCRVLIDGSVPPVEFSTTRGVVSLGVGIRWGLGLAALRALVSF